MSKKEIEPLTIAASPTTTTTTGNNKNKKGESSPLPSSNNNDNKNITTTTTNNNNKKVSGGLDCDSLIARLTTSITNEGKQSNKPITTIEEREIEQLVLQTREIFLEQPMLLDIEAPVKIVGDVHGQFYDLLRLFELGGYPSSSSSSSVRYLFLGDFVDRGKYSLETIILLLCYKLKYNKSFYMLRGNHECASINRIYGFYDECKRRYSIHLWKVFTDCFNCLPVAALIDEKIFCMHGGLSPELQSMDQLRKYKRPIDVPDSGLLCDLLWSDPDKDVVGWGDNERGVSYTFGPDVLSKFLRKQNMDLVCRAHQVVEDGYEFFGQRRLVTIFSAPNYCDEFNNSGAMMSVDDTLMCSFHILKPAEKKRNTRFYS